MADIRIAIVLAIILTAGAALILSEIRWFARPSLRSRLASYAPGAQSTTTPSLRLGFIPVVDEIATRITSLIGLRGDLSSRLTRAHDSRSTNEVRLQQLLSTLGALVVAISFVAAIRPPAAFAVLFVVAPVGLSFLLIEQRIASAAEARTKRIVGELPVISEQMAMLLAAGFSLGAVVNRLADRGDGVISEDLRGVRDRVRQGIPINVALREWSNEVQNFELDRLVSVIQAGSNSGDLSRLVSDEAKSIRRESQRRLAEIIDRRAQQVWVPVTVATLIPGVIFLCIPFLQALSFFNN